MPRAKLCASARAPSIWPRPASGTKSSASASCVIRRPEWTNIEEDIRPSKHDFTGRVVLIDCITLWATNYFFDMQQDVDQALEALKKEFDTLVQQDATFIFVTNELGMGGMSESRTQRLFTQLQGWMNQHVAARADRVTLMVSGLPLTVKG